MELSAAFWSHVKENIKSRNKDNKLIETWLDPVVFVELIATGAIPKMILGVPTSLHQYFVIENLLDKIYAEIAESIKTPFEVDLFITGAQAASPEPTTLAEAFNQVEKQMAPRITSQNSPSNDRGRDLLNPEYTFSTFVVGRNTEFAHAASGQELNAFFSDDVKKHGAR